MITQLFAKIGALFLMLVSGALARFKGIITDEALDSLCKIVLYVTLPFLFIYTLSTKCIGRTIFSLWTAPLFAVLIIFVGFVISTLAASFLKLPQKKKNTFYLPI